MVCGLEMGGRIGAEKPLVQGSGRPTRRARMVERLTMFVLNADT